MHRRLPGEGALGVVDHVRTLDELGVRAPIGIEVFDAALLATRARRRRLGRLGVRCAMSLPTPCDNQYNQLLVTATRTGGRTCG